jgi:multiple sugar transport system ATP-binding protein
MNFITGPPAQRHKAAIIGVRPEHFNVSASTGEIKGKVEYAEVLGSDSFLYVTTLEGTLTVREPGKTVFGPGDTVNLALITEHVHRFGENGLRLP